MLDKDGNDNKVELVRSVSPASRSTGLQSFDPYSMPFPAEYIFPAMRGKHLREYWQTVMRRKWVVLACVLAAVAVAVTYTMQVTPLYKATAQLEIEQQSDNILPYQQVQADSNSSYAYDEYLQTQIKHMTSRSLAGRVAAAAGLDKVNELQRAEENKAGMLPRWAWLQRLGIAKNARDTAPLTENERQQQSIDRLLAGIEIKPARNARVVEVSYLSANPALAAKIVNTLSQEYIEYNFQAKFDSTSRATDFLQRQLVDLKAKVEKSDSELINYARTHSIISVGEKDDVATQALADINGKLVEARAARMEKESVYRTLAHATPENFPQALRTPMIENVERGLVSDEQELAKLTAQLGASMPQVKQLESRVSRAREQLRRERQLAIENSRMEYDTAMAKENLLLSAFNNQKIVVDKLNESNIKYNILKREVETNKQLYDGLLQRMKEAGVAAGLKSSNIRIVDKAQVPASPYSPDLKKNLSLGLLLGLMGGLGLAFFLNYLDNTVKTPEDVEEMTGLPSLGLVPSLESSHSRYGYRYGGLKHKHSPATEALVKQGVELASLAAGSSLIAEAFRGVRTAILLSTPDHPASSIMVTSSKAGEGKTTTVCNLALSLAQMGKRVLVMDCDMRRPKIKKIFGGNGHAGLSEYLTGQVDFGEVVQESQIPNLHIVHSGTPPPNPGELLGSRRMAEAIKAAEVDYDFVMIDTPPLMSVTDPLIIASMADGVVLVTKGGSSPPEILKKAKKSLDLVHARILGVVCNAVNLHSTAYHYYYHQYQDYHSYVEDQDQST